MAGISNDLTRKGIERGAVEMFLKSRKSEKTKEYSRAILEELSDQFEKDMQNPPDRERSPNGGHSLKNTGWIRTKDIIKRVKVIPNESTFYLLLKSLHTAGLIERREETKILGAGKNPTSYRVPGYYPSNFFISNKEYQEKLERDLSEAWHNIGKLGMKLFAAEVLLSKYHKNESGYNPREEIKKETKRLFPDYGEVIIDKKKN